MSKMIIPEDYKPHLNLIETEVAIKMIKDTFERRLAEQLRLTRVSAPLFLLKNTGLNDNLNGLEKPVSFTSFELNHDDEIEIIHSLAKWKRDALHRYGFEKHTGLYTDMNAIRKDEELDKYGVNNSLTHVDFMIGSNDMNIVGITHQGEEVQVFKDGNWAF